MNKKPNKKLSQIVTFLFLSLKQRIAKASGMPSSTPVHFQLHKTNAPDKILESNKYRKFNFRVAHSEEALEH